MAAISSSVGLGCPNNPADIRVVQQLLNRKNMSLLPADGIINDPYTDQTIAAILAFQKLFMPKPDGKVVPNGQTFKRLNGDRPMFGIVRAPSFRPMSEDGNHLDPELLERVLRLANYLLDMEMVTENIILNDGVRSRKRAHLKSTSWNISQGRVPLDNLLALSDGRDLDGNQWYDPKWKEGLGKDADTGRFDRESQAVLMKKIKDNANRLCPQGPIAAEGYPLSDPRSKPNVHKVVSNHVDGNAVDMHVSWKPGFRIGTTYVGGDRRDPVCATIRDGSNGDLAAEYTVGLFGLCRPVRSEPWHFQLERSRAENFDPSHHMYCPLPTGVLEIHRGVMG